MVVRQDRRYEDARVKSAATITCALLAIGVGAVFAANPSWCLSMGGLGAVRTGMTVEEVLRLADWPGLERKTQTGECWYLPYRGGASDIDLMIIKGRVVRIEIKGASKLHTFAGAGIGTTEDELRILYGSRLDVQPHKYDESGHTITLKSSSGEYGLRFETSKGKVTAIQGGPWEHLNYVEGCG
jgi:hypothetical protein